VNCLAAQRARAAATVDAYWPRISNPQWFSERYAQALARGDTWLANYTLKLATSRGIQVRT
jgi:hypothetical protein